MSKNGLAFSFGHLKHKLWPKEAKRKARSQTVYLTPDQKKSKIDLIYSAAEGMRHTVGKLLTRATTLL